ncbi:MAG: hypothetical protein IKP53_08280 [Candidatus Methanomethylophilaceae archaeon]|nr:hypothetical protein [Candidatus Methanomethylophilaceae archaeon]
MTDVRKELADYLRNAPYDAYVVLSEYLIENSDGRLWDIEGFSEELSMDPWFYIHEYPESLPLIDERKHSFVTNWTGNGLRGLTEDQMGKMAKLCISENDDVYGFVLSSYRTLPTSVRRIVEGTGKSPNRKAPARRKAPAKKPAAKRRAKGARR